MVESTTKYESVPQYAKGLSSTEAFHDKLVIKGENNKE